MTKTLYGDGTHLVVVNEAREVVLTEKFEGNTVTVSMSERAFGEVVIGWQRHRERMAEGIEAQVTAPTGIESAEEAGQA